ncbi:hypothetical protein [Pseudomonas sp. Fl4BN1]|nr:hypothetical protein [Pseudomonas sp. Fl4BN1]NBF09423.1 hypothetical protein [Pseudomonas sp. Fl4BN1]
MIQLPDNDGRLRPRLLLDAADYSTQSLKVYEPVSFVFDYRTKSGMAN